MGPTTTDQNLKRLAALGIHTVRDLGQYAFNKGMTASELLLAIESGDVHDLQDDPARPTHRG
jgi:hypothetical protein